MYSTMLIQVLDNLQSVFPIWNFHSRRAAFENIKRTAESRASVIPGSRVVERAQTLAIR
jgi:hypothetical protein